MSATSRAPYAANPPTAADYQAALARVEELQTTLRERSDALNRTAEANDELRAKVARVEAHAAALMAVLDGLICDGARQHKATDPRVHNHPPYRPVCAERLVNGQLRGHCLNDDGSEKP